MSQSAKILAKIARNAEILGLTVVSSSSSDVVIYNAAGANNLTISYVDASGSPAQVLGVSDSASPYLGIGVNTPGMIQIKGAAGATMNLTMDTIVAMRVLAMCASFANSIQLRGSGNQDLGVIRGQQDLIGMGQ